MSLVQQVIQEVTTLQRQIQDQMRLIEEFKRENTSNIALVRTELQGSRSGFDAKMLQSLDRAEASLDKSSAALRQAEAALRRVAMI